MSERRHGPNIPGRGRARGRGRGAPQHRSRTSQHPDVALWKQRVHHWYPRFLQRTYFVPPVYMNKVQYHTATVAGLNVDVTHPPVANLPRGAPIRLQRSTTRDDKSQQRILYCLQKLAETQAEVMFVISQLQFVDFLANAEYAEAASRLPRPVDLKKENKHRGDFDLLLLHKHYGIVVAEIKTIGDNFSSLTLTEEEQDGKVAKKVQLAVRQLKKAEDMLTHLVSDIRPPPQIQKTIMLPNISRRQLERVLTKNQNIRKDLCDCLIIPDAVDPVDMCLCADHLSDVNTPYDVTDDVLREMSSWWTRRVAGPYVSVRDDIYENLVARFCGPATTVQVFSPTHRPVSLHTQGEGVSETSRRFTRFVLHPDQLTALNFAPPCVYVTGPPGTGKTLVLVVKALDWLCHELEVHVMSTWSGSLAASHLIVHQVTVTAQVTPGERVHLHVFDLQEEGQVEEAVTCLVEAAKRGPLCVIADEVCGSEFTDFCSSLLQRVPGVRLWAASLYHADRPSCLEEVRMTEPLRTPPAVTREVQQAFWIERFGAVLGYAESSVPPPSEGPAARVVRHQGQGHAEGRPGECERCGLEIAHLLRELHVGQYEKSQTGPLDSEASIVASQTTTSTSAKTCPASPPPLQFRDVFILTANVLTDAVLHDEETDNTGNILRPASGMLRGLRRARVPVRVVRSRDNDVIADVAKMAGADEVVAGEVGAVRGLERKIVIWVQTDRPVTGTEDESWGRLEGASRATGQVVWVVWPQDDDLIS